MKVGIANDHHGIMLKNRIIKYLESKNIEVANYGCETKENTDYIDYAVKLCNGYLNNEFDFGILICGTGIGMSIVANKINGIMCAKINNKEEAILSKAHNRANVLSLGENTNDVEEIIDAFINTKSLEDERYIRRINRIKELEKSHE